MTSIDTLLISREIDILCYLCGMTVRIWCFNAHGLKLYEMRNHILASVFCLYTRAEPRRDLTFSREQPEREGRRPWVFPISQFFFLFFFFKLFRIGYVAEDTNPYEASVSSAIGSRLGS